MTRTTLLTTAIIASFAMSAAAKDDALTPLNGKDTSGWKTKEPASRSHWKVGSAKLDGSDTKKIAFSSEGSELVNAESHGVDIYSEAKHGDAKIEVEVMVPKGSNSGIYVHGEYEIQVLDSFGKADGKLGAGDMGGLYNAAPPKTNASKAPGEWQKYVIDFRAPKFDAAGKKTANAKFVSIELNGKVIHENVEMKGPTPTGVSGKEAAEGPIMFQGDHGAVAYRNLKITPVK